MGLLRNRCVGLFLAASFLTGCGSIPDVAPFADATASLKSSVTIAFDHTQQRTQDVADALDPSTAIDSLGSESVDQAMLDALRTRRDEYLSLASRVRDAKPPREALLTALVRYADGLASVAAAGNAGAESAKAVSAQVQTLVGTFLANPLPGMAVQGAELLLREAIKIGALHSLGQAVDAAHPIVERVVAVLRADLADLETQLVTKSGAVSAALELPFSDAMNERRALLAQHTRLIGSLAATYRPLPAGLTDSERATELAQRAADRSRVKSELELVAFALDSTGGWADALEQRVQRSRLAALQSVELVSKSRVLLEEWSSAHDDLRAAIKESRQLNVRALTALTVEINDLIRSNREKE